MKQLTNLCHPLLKYSMLQKQGECQFFKIWSASIQSIFLYVLAKAREIITFLSLFSCKQTLFLIQARIALLLCRSLKQSDRRINVITKSIVLYFSIQGSFSVNRKDLRALTLLGPTRENLLLDPLAVQYLNNQLYI